jgi:DNA-binding SARP family transcriptional activator
MEIRILGPLEVVADGDSVDLPSGKARLLLATLVVHANRVVSTDRLFEFLWHGQPPDSAANTLQTYVSHLRRSLEPDRAPHQRSRLLITREPGYLLALDRGQIDAVRFERLVEQARLILASAPGRAAALLQTALSLWRGEPLADFTFEPFAQAEITRLTELRLTASEDRIEAELALGRHAALCGELAQLVSEHPLRERLSGQLMVALYRCGRQAEALGAYADLRDTLVEQLGIDPSPPLEQLQAAILRQHRELDWPGASEDPAPSPEVGPSPLATVEDPPVERSLEAILGSARSAVRRCQWREAFDLFSAADALGGLGGEDLDSLAEVEIALADDEVEAARAAAAELAEIATRYARPALAAAAECAQARVLLAEGDPATAATTLRRGIARWRQAGAPYETARARLLLGEALERQGDRRRALVEFDAAGAAFESLGAALDLQRATRLLAAT